MYYLLLILLYPLALLPMRVLYLLSDAVYGLLYYILGYRKQITLDNLRHAFPEKSEAETRQIMKRFYRNFCDQWIETLKMLTISEKELNRRVRGNWEVFRQLDADGRNTYALLGHNFNWEWANLACQYNSPQQFAGVYLPVDNNAFNRLLYRMRTRGGGWLISMKEKRGFQRLQHTRYIVGLIADQNPSNLSVATWLPFMHREAPFFKGSDQLPRRGKAAVVFAGIKRLKRGYYEVNLQLFTDDAGKLNENDILHAYVTFLEAQLRAQPDNWLWTHKRWKHIRI